MSSNTPSLVLRCRCDAQGTITDADPAWRTLLGLPAAWVQGSRLAERVDPADAARVPELLARGGPVDLGIRTAEGVVLSVRATARPLPAGGAAVDLVPALTPEALVAALAACRHRLTSLVERANEAIFIKDLDLRYVFINEAGARLLDRTPEEVLGRDDHSIFLTETADEIIEVDRRVLETGQPVTYRPTRRDLGKPRIFLTTKHPYVDQDGKVAGVMGVSRDVTPWVRAQEKAQQADRSFRALIETTPELVLVSDDQALVVYANPAAHEALGMAPGELVGLPLAEVLQQGPASPPADGRPWEGTLGSASGEEIPVEAVSVEILWDGAPAWALLARDQRERRSLQARLAQADRLATVGVLAGGVAHEINNPLTFVRHQVEAVAETLATEDPLDRADLGRRMANAAQGVARIGAIVRDLSVFARDDEDGTRAADVHELLERALQLASVHVRHKARIQREFEAVPPVSCRPGRLGQVFLNLLVNAAQALPSGHSADHVVTLRTMRVGEHVRVTVSDTGPGIPADILPRVFERAFTTKSPGEGTGLGLWLSQGFVREMGGEITVRSLPGHGASFSVTLPIADASVAPTPPASGPTPPAPHRAPPTEPAPAGRYRLAVIDDEPIICEIVTEVFEDEAEVVTFRSGRAALPVLLDPDGVPFDAILCDLVMPDIDGIHLFRTLETEAPGQARRTLFLTGGAVSEEARRFLQTYEDRVLTKPFSLSRLMDAVRRTARALPSPRGAPAAGPAD